VRQTITIVTNDNHNENYKKVYENININGEQCKQRWLKAMETLESTKGANRKVSK